MRAHAEPTRLPGRVRRVLSAPGRPLAPPLLAAMNSRFGHDFGQVRVHTGRAAAESATEVGAAAYTVGRQVVLGERAAAAHGPEGHRTLAHELAHVVQQSRGGGAAPGLAAGHPLDLAADTAAHAAVAGTGPVRVAGASGPGLARQGKPLADELRELASQPKGRVFDVLRLRGPAPTDAAALKAIQDRFAADTDDRWLAEALLSHGAEPLWPAVLISERVRREQAKRGGAGRWAPEPGNIRADLPYPAEAKAGKIPPVTAYFFPGSSDERALVIGGVHGSEVQGARVVESMRAELAAASLDGRPPKFTTILVPVLNPRSHQRTAGGAVDLSQQGQRNLPRRADEPTQAPGTATTSGIEPNRTFPAPGESYADVRKRVTEGKPELEYRGAEKRPDVEFSTSVMPPETRVLVQLVERFKPSRIASVHAHGIGTKARAGDDPGIFVDPAKGKEAAGDKLTEDMIAAGRKWLKDKGPASVGSGRADPFLGNIGTTPTRYSASVARVPGYSFGDWAPSLGISTITVEIPQYAAAADLKVPRADQLKVEQMHRDVLIDVFLQVPPKKKP